MCIILLLFYLILVFKSFSNLFFIVDFTVVISFSHSASRKMTLYYFISITIYYYISICLCFLHCCRPSFLHVILNGCYRIETCIKSARTVRVFNKSRGQDSISSSNFSKRVINCTETSYSSKICILSQVRKHH